MLDDSADAFPDVRVGYIWIRAMRSQLFHGSGFRKVHDVVGLESKLQVNLE